MSFSDTILLLNNSHNKIIDLMIAWWSKCKHWYSKYFLKNKSTHIYIPAWKGWKVHFEKTLNAFYNSSENRIKFELRQQFDTS